MLDYDQIFVPPSTKATLEFCVVTWNLTCLLVRSVGRQADQHHAPGLPGTRAIASKQFVSNSVPMQDVNEAAVGSLGPVAWSALNGVVRLTLSCSIQPARISRLQRHCVSI